MSIIDKIVNFVKLSATNPEKAEEKVTQKAEKTLEDVSAFAKQVKSTGEMIGLEVEKGIDTSAQYLSEKVGAAKHKEGDSTPKNIGTIAGNIGVLLLSMTPFGFTSCKSVNAPEMPNTNNDQPEDNTKIEIPRFDEYGRSVVETYNGSGQIIESKVKYPTSGNPFDEQTNYKYDNQGRLSQEKSMVYNYGTHPEVSFEVYDDEGNYAGYLLGTLSESEYSYDLNNRIQTKTSTIYCKPINVAENWGYGNFGFYDYDVPETEITNYSYTTDSNGKIENKKLTLNGQTISETSYTYGTNGNVVEQLYKNPENYKIRTKYKYDNMNQLISKKEYHVSEIVENDENGNNTTTETGELILLEEEYNSNHEIVYRKSYQNIRKINNNKTTYYNSGSRVDIDNRE